MQQVPHFMQAIEKLDPDFARLVSAARDKVYEEGALDRKTKVLIAMALDAAGSHPSGVASLARRARALGATDQEIIEVVRIAWNIAGTPGLIAGLAAFEE